MANLYESYSKLPSWSRGVIAVVGVGFVVATSFIVYRSVIKLTSGTPNTSGEDAKSDLKDLAKNGIKPTYSDTQFSSWSEKLAYALAYNTDEEAVYNIMRQMKNEADILKLIQVFGSRKVETFPFFFQDATLSEAIISSMNSSEIAKVNTILASKNIKIRF